MGLVPSLLSKPLDCEFGEKLGNSALGNSVFEFRPEFELEFREDGFRELELHAAGSIGFERSGH